VTYNGGIPIRSTIYKTLSPSGDDDTAAIQNALNSCPANQVVQLTAGTFRITGNGISFRKSDCTLRGMGPGTGATGGNLAKDSMSNLVGGGTGTFLLKADRQTNRAYAVMYVNKGNGYSISINLAQDAALNTYSLALVNNPSIRVGEIVLVDENTDNDRTSSGVRNSARRETARADGSHVRTAPSASSWKSPR
jgi:hypothetical protein